ncbi:MAG: hypothetical protein WCB44_34230 [Stellaceae bacterium]
MPAAAQPEYPRNSATKSRVKNRWPQHLQQICSGISSKGCDFRRVPGTPSAVRVRICENKSILVQSVLAGTVYLTFVCGDFPGAAAWPGTL